MLVVADNWEKAKEIAMENYEQDYTNGNERDAYVAYDTEITAPDEASKDVIPWGVSDDDPRRDWTIEHWCKHRDGLL